LHRNKKCYDQISPEICTQFVGADIYLALCISPTHPKLATWKSCRISIDSIEHEKYADGNDYPPEEKRAPSTARIICTKDEVESRRALIGALREEFPENA
jgi:hypothetical protein